MIAASLAELIRMAPQASALPAVRLPRLPRHARRTLRCVGDRHGTCRFSLAPACAAHPGNGKRALGTRCGADSHYFARHQPARHAAHTRPGACQLPGRNALEPLVSVSKLRYFWRHSLRMALGARAAARALDLRDPERPFVEGLLADVGLLLMWHADADAMRQVEAEAIGQGCPRTSGSAPASASTTPMSLANSPGRGACRPP